MCSRRSARASTSTPPRSAAASTRSASGSCSRRPIIRPPGSSFRCGASSPSAPSSNFLGPLTNPAGARRQLIGVADPAFLEVMAGALARLGTDRALLVSSEDGLDELSTSGVTHVVEVNGEQIERYAVSPHRRRSDPVAAGGRRGRHARAQRRRDRGDPGRRARARRATSRRSTRARRSTREGGADSLAEGVEAAQTAIDDGAAAAALERYRALSAELAGAPA